MKRPNIKFQAYAGRAWQTDRGKTDARVLCVNAGARFR